MFILSLLGANAIVRQRNAMDDLSYPDNDTWFTPFYILNDWGYRRWVGKKKDNEEIGTKAMDDGQLVYDLKG